MNLNFRCPPHSLQLASIPRGRPWFRPDGARVGMKRANTQETPRTPPGRARAQWESAMMMISLQIIPGTSRSHIQSQTRSRHKILLETCSQPFILLGADGGAWRESGRISAGTSGRRPWQISGHVDRRKGQNPGRGCRPAPARYPVEDGARGGSIIYTRAGSPTGGSVYPGVKAGAAVLSEDSRPTAP